MQALWTRRWDQSKDVSGRSTSMGAQHRQDGIMALGLSTANHPEERRPEMGRSTYKPGQQVPSSGQVRSVGPRGGESGTERTVTKGEVFPPTPGRGMGYRYVDFTNNGSGRMR